jgi:hypothetical protein
MDLKKEAIRLKKEESNVLRLVCKKISSGMHLIRITHNQGIVTRRFAKTY